MIVVCGEALADLARLPGEPLAYRGTPGGGPANTAVALGRLGVPVAMLARLSRDPIGQVLRAHLERAGVDLSLAVDADEPSSLALVDLGPDGGATYSFYLQGTADWQWSAQELPGLPDAALALHTGSLALALPPGGAALEALLVRERGRRTLSLDPNVRPALLGDPADYRVRLDRWVGLVDVVKASVEDVAWVYPDLPVGEVAARWLGLGARLVVLTAGSDGVTGWSAGYEVQVPAPAVSVCDTVGAGDTFTAGLLGWLHRHDRLGPGLASLNPDELAAALRLAAHLAAVVVGRQGADPPFARELPADVWT